MSLPLPKGVRDVARSLLLRTYDVPVLALSQMVEPTSKQRAGICVDLEIPKGTLVHDDLSPESLGVPDDLEVLARLKAAASPTLPEDLLIRLRDALDSVRPGEPLWLQFRRPYAHLPALAWELALQHALEVPILRLPFTNIPAAADVDRLDVALCVPVTRTRLKDDAVRLTREYVDAVNRFTDELPRIRLFTNDHDVKAVAGAYTGRMEIAPQHSHARDESEGVDSAWLRWMVDVVAPDSVDVVHFIGRARVLGNFGVLETGPAPGASERGEHLINSGQLVTGLTRLGAWSLGFTAMRGQDVALRVLSHRMTQLLAGPVLVHAPPNGQEASMGEDLVNAYRFLFTRAGATPPATGGLTLYCHPRNLLGVRKVAPADGGEDLDLELSRALADCTLDTGGDTEHRVVSIEPSAWLATDQRLLERWATVVVASEPGARDEDYTRGVRDALNFVSSAIEQAAGDLDKPT